MEYWIDGYFTPAWTGKSYFSHDRQIFVPKFATIRREADRIYIDAKFAESQIKLVNSKKIIDWSDKKEVFLRFFVRALNVPWKKEPYVEPEPRFKVSLP